MSWAEEQSFWNISAHLTEAESHSTLTSMQMQRAMSISVM